MKFTLTIHLNTNRELVALVNLHNTKGNDKVASDTIYHTVLTNNWALRLRHDDWDHRKRNIVNIRDSSWNPQNPQKTNLAKRLGYEISKGQQASKHLLVCLLRIRAFQYLETSKPNS